MRGTRVNKRINVRARFRELRFFDGKLFGLGGSCRIVRRFFPFNGHGIFTGFFRGCFRIVFFACISRAGIAYGSSWAFLNTFDLGFILLTAVSPTGNRYIDRLFGAGNCKFQNLFATAVRKNMLCQPDSQGIVAGIYGFISLDRSGTACDSGNSYTIILTQFQFVAAALQSDDSYVYSVLTFICKIGSSQIGIVFYCGDLQADGIGFHFRFRYGNDLIRDRFFPYLYRYRFTYKGICTVIIRQRRSYAILSVSCHQYQVAVRRCREIRRYGDIVSILYRFRN